MTITRHFVTLGERQVHYRRAGSGPALFMLHQSPTSSAELIPQIEDYAKEFTVIAPDTPGYGCSDPLPLDYPETPDFADALAKLFDALGVGKAALYGTHTGAMIAAEFARRHADRVSVAVMDGYVVLTADEREDLLANYFEPPFIPQADGRHMAWLWSRIRDQVLFFPWYRKEKAARMKFELPPAEYFQPYILDFLRAGEVGKRAYRAAFTCIGEDIARNIGAPTWLMAYEQDPLCEHLDRLPGDLPDHVKAEKQSDRDGLLARAGELFRAHPGDKQIPPAPPAEQPAGKPLRKDILGGGEQALFVRRNGASDDRPVLLIHGPGKSSLSFTGLANALAGRASVIVPDLPGHGETGAVASVSDVSVESASTALAQALKSADQYIDILAAGGGTQIAVELARSEPDLIHKLALLDVWHFEKDDKADLRENLVPPLTPRWYGGHLLEAWFAVRDGEIFWPWYKPTRANERQSDYDLDPERIHQLTVDLLKSVPFHRGLSQSCFDYDLTGTLSGLKQQILFAAEDTSPHHARTMAATDLAPAGRFDTLGTSPESQAELLAAFFAS